MPLISTKECVCLTQDSTWICNVTCPGLHIVVSDFEVRGFVYKIWFVDIDGIVDHHGLNLHFIITSHIESLNIKRIID